jgi:hypothetical protein
MTVQVKGLKFNLIIWSMKLDYIKCTTIGYNMCKFQTKILKIECSRAILNRTLFLNTRYFLSFNQTFIHQCFLPVETIITERNSKCCQDPRLLADFLTSDLFTSLLCYLGKHISFLITRLSYIRVSYNRNILTKTKRAFCRDPPTTFLTSRLSYIRCFLYPGSTV